MLQGLQGDDLESRCLMQNLTESPEPSVLEMLSATNGSSDPKSNSQPRAGATTSTKVTQYRPRQSEHLEIHFFVTQRHAARMRSQAQEHPARAIRV